ncbi:hypothetical protein [Bradyrhizobium sp. USDA 10063]
MRILLLSHTFDSLIRRSNIELWSRTRDDEMRDRLPEWVKKEVVLIIEQTSWLIG